MKKLFGTDDESVNKRLEEHYQKIKEVQNDLEKFYPEKVEGTIPTIEEIEAKLSEGNEE